MSEAAENQLIAEIAVRRGWSFRLLDGGLRLLTGSGGSLALPAGYRPLNSHTGCVLASDKCSCHALLSTHGIGTPEQLAVDLEGLDVDSGSVSESESWRAFVVRVEELGFPVFVKPDSGSRGQLARRIPDASALRRQLRLIRRRFRRAIVQPFLRQPEYRLFYLDGELEFSYRRLPPVVVGDGKRTLRECVERRARELPLFDPAIGLDREWILEQILQHGVTWNTPLPQGLRIELGGVSNLLAGGRPVGFTRQAPPGCRDWLRRLAGLLGLRLFAVDLFSRSELADPTDYCVLDVNSNPHWEVLRSMGREAVWKSTWERILELALDGGSYGSHSCPIDK